MSDETTRSAAGAAAEEIAQVREEHWRAAGSDRVELGLIAGLLEMDISGAPAGPAIDPGEVLAAARAAIHGNLRRLDSARMLATATAFELLAADFPRGTVDRGRVERAVATAFEQAGHVRGPRPLSVEFDTYERDMAPMPRTWLRYWDNLPPAGRSVEELSARREEIIGLFRGPDLPTETAARLSEERERIEVELERRTRPEPNRVTDEMVTRAIDKGLGADLAGLGDRFVGEFLRPAVRGILEDILGIGPAAPEGVDRG